jgi:hypothetical protein
LDAGDSEGEHQAGVVASTLPKRWHLEGRGPGEHDAMVELSRLDMDAGHSFEQSGDDNRYGDVTNP